MKTRRSRSVTGHLGRRASSPKQATLAARAWLRRNHAALVAYNDHVKQDGVFSEGLRSF